MPLFDLTPKATPRALYGRDRELAELVRLIDHGRWVVLLGPRMVGKTSLLQSANRKVRRRSIYVNLWGAQGTAGLLRAFAHGLSAERKLLSILRPQLVRVEGVTVGSSGLAVELGRRPMRTLWDLLDVVGREGHEVVIELDEVQELAPISGPFTRLLANILSSHAQVSFVFTGSYFGLLHTLLDPPGDSPLSGRPPARLELGPFSEETSIGFLRQGLREYGLRLPEADLVKAVRDHLDGTPGWLSLFGNHLAVQRLPFDAALSDTLAEGKKVVRSELAHFLEGRKVENYWAALEALCAGATTWTSIREALSIRRGAPVNDNTVRSVLGALTGAGVVGSTGGGYRVPDPMVRAFIRDGRPPVRPSVRGSDTPASD